MPQNIMCAPCAVIRPDHFKFASYRPVACVYARKCCVWMQEGVACGCKKVLRLWMQEGVACVDVRMCSVCVCRKV